MKALVGVPNHIFILEIAAAAKASDDGACAYFLAEVGSEALVALHFHLRIVLENGLAPRDAVLQIKSGTLFHIDADGDINLVEDGQSPQNDAAMPQGDGVEGTRENGYSFHCVVFTISNRALQQAQEPLNTYLIKDVELVETPPQKYYFVTTWCKSFPRISLIERNVPFKNASISSFPMSFISVMPSSVCGLGWMASPLSIKYQ